MVPPGEVVQIARSFPNFGVKLVQLQYLRAGFEVCEVRIDSNVFKDSKWDGQTVEKGSKLTTVFKNVTEETQSLQGVWYADLLEETPAAATAEATPQKKRARTGRDFTAAVTPGYNEVAICLTFDQLRRIHEVLNQASSSFMHHNEIPGILRPFNDAMESLRDG